MNPQDESAYVTTQTSPATLARRASCAGLLAVLTAAALAASAAGSGSSQPSTTARDGRAVIVRARAGREAAAEALVRRLGGVVRTRLQIVDGFSATLPSGAAATLRRNAAILSVTANRRLQPDSAGMSADYDPTSDGYSMSAVTQLTGARAWWNAGYTGKGVDVALIDSGVSPVQGLSDGGKLVYGPDLSLESQAPNLTELDTYGHGTFMAGLIAGRDDTPSSLAPPSTYLGMAPDARVVSLKVGDADGGTDVSQVIAAVDWIVQHRTDNGLNIRVVNLSYGTNSLQPFSTDPLAYAFEQAWKKGLVVVAAAGNTGYQRGKGAPGLADPAYDPYVIGVAAADTMGTSALTDDAVASFSASSSGCKGCKNPDFTAPGAHMQGLRVSNCFIDTNHPEGVLNDRYFRGSGTSEATAITSGAIALVLQKYPGLTPDMVKKYFTGNALRLGGSDSLSQGAGEFRLGVMLTKSPPNYRQSFTKSTGLGLVEGARGSDHLTKDGVTLSGEKDIFGAAIATSTLASAEANGNSWSGGVWNGNSWSGNSWSGNSWSGNSWSGNSWSGNSWSSGSWSSNSWSGNSWSSADWSGNSWSGNSWSGGSWASAFWG